MAVVLPPINEVIDLHSMHLAMARRDLPIPVMTGDNSAGDIDWGLLVTNRARRVLWFEVAPLSLTVDWLVLTHHIEVTETDIARFAKLYPMNARPVQELDRRFILSSSPH